MLTLSSFFLRFRGRSQVPPTTTMHPPPLLYAHRGEEREADKQRKTHKLINVERRRMGDVSLLFLFFFFLLFFKDCARVKMCCSNIPGLLWYSGRVEGERTGGEEGEFCCHTWKARLGVWEADGSM